MTTHTWWERGKSAANRVVKAIVYWQEVPWALVALAGMVVAFYLLPRLDPSAGIDGWGRLWTLGMSVLVGQVVAFSAWWCKNHYMVDMSDEEEKLIMDRASRSNKAWTPLLVIVIDRLTFFGWLLLWLLVVRGA